MPENRAGIPHRLDPVQCPPSPAAVNLTRTGSVANGKIQKQALNIM